MTSTTPLSAGAGSQARTDHRLTAAAAGLVAFALTAYFTWQGANSDGEIVSMLALEAVVALVVFGWLVPTRTVTGAPATALTLGIIATLLVLPAFWSGLPLLLGVAGVMIGRASRGKRAGAGVVLGALASAAYLYLYVVVDMIQGKL